jgi:hypothetical protein
MTLILMNAKLHIQTQTWRSCSECFSFETFGTIFPTLPEYDNSTCQQFQNSSAEGSRLQSGPCCSWSDCGIDFVVWIAMDGGISSSFPEPCAQPCHIIKIHAHQVQLTHPCLRIRFFPNGKIYCRFDYVTASPLPRQQFA